MRHFLQEQFSSERKLLHLCPLLLDQIEVVFDDTMPKLEHFELALILIVAARHLVKVEPTTGAHKLLAHRLKEEGLQSPVLVPAHYLFTMAQRLLFSAVFLQAE